MTKTAEELLEEYRAERYIGKEPEEVTVQKYLNNQTITLNNQVTALAGQIDLIEPLENQVASFSSPIVYFSSQIVIFSSQISNFDSELTLISGHVVGISSQVATSKNNIISLFASDTGLGNELKDLTDVVEDIDDRIKVLESMHGL